MLIKVGTWLWRIMIVFTVATFPATGSQPEIERLYAAIPVSGCAIIVSPPDHAGTLEALQHAHEFNALLDRHVAAVKYDYFTREYVLSTVERWTPQITCVAREFDIPPELLAGIMALELDLDYNVADAVMDGLVVSPAGDVFSKLEFGAAYAGIHFKHLRPALVNLGEHFSGSPFYQTYYHFTITHDNVDLTEYATRYRLLDLSNAAVMARTYALLRMGSRPLSDMTITDMAFTWSAYRGGVINTPADLKDNHRWSVDYLQKASNPQIFGDTLIAVPYFSYFRALYHGPHVAVHPPIKCCTIDLTEF